MNDITCPYCYHQFDLCHDDGAFYDEDELEKEKCPECDKQFLVQSYMSWSHEAVTADCLNDGEHQWEKECSKFLIEEHPYLAAREECTECGEKRLVELKALDK